MFKLSDYATLHELLAYLIPDAERLSGLSHKGAPLPTFRDATNDFEAYYQLTMYRALGMYVDSRSLDMPSTLIFNGAFFRLVGETQYASTLLHELVHWLQDVNGLSNLTDDTKESHRPIELLAYQTQAKWLREQGLEPALDFPNAMEPAFFAQQYGGEVPVW